MTRGPGAAIEVPQFVRLAEATAPKVGAEASVLAMPGLIGLLEPAGGWGAGYQAALTVPFGVAVTAALGALGCDDPLQERWMVRDAAIEWATRASARDVIVSDAKVVAVEARHILVEAHAAGSETGRLLDARIRILPMHDGRYAALAKAPVAAARASHRDDQAHDGMIFAPETLRMLTQHGRNGEPPLGRRTHPLGAAPLGAALSAALHAAGEPNVDRPERLRVQDARVRWYLPLPVDAAFMARTRETGAAASTVEVFRRDGRIALSAFVHCVSGLRAEALTGAKVG